MFGRRIGPNLELGTHEQCREGPVLDGGARQARLERELVRRPGACYDGLPTVPINNAVRACAHAIVAASIMPSKAAADALHVAAAAVAGVQYLLTLNCRHIANAHELPRVYRLLEDLGYGQLLICTPAEFLGGDDDDDEESNS